MDEQIYEVTVYFRSSRMVEVGSDDDDMPIIDSAGSDKLQTRKMDVRDYEDFVGDEDVAAGEEGGHFEVFVVTGRNDRIIPSWLVKKLAEC